MSSRNEAWRSGAVASFLGIAAVFLLVFAPAAGANTAPLDPGFGDGGVSLLSPPAAAGALGLAQDTSGRLLAAGTNAGDDFIIARYLPNGGLDPSFGSQSPGGSGYTAASPGIGTGAYAIGVQPSGKIVVTGEVIPGTLIVLRYLEDGQRDLGFGHLGEARIRGGGDGAAANDLDVDRDGGIFVAGYGFDRPRAPRGILARFLANGRLDRSFGSGGVVKIGRGAEATEIVRVEALASGKVLWVGDSGGRIVVGRMRADGAADHGFGGGDGRVVVDVGGGCRCGVASGLARDSGGRIVVSANLTGSGQRSAALLRLRSNGKLDRGFGRSGIVHATVGRRLIGEDVAIAPSGRIFLAGASITTDGKARATVVRYLPSGRLDRAFGPAGAFIYRLGVESIAHAALVQNGGRVVVAGRANSAPSPFPDNPSPFDNARFLLMRFTG